MTGKLHQNMTAVFGVLIGIVAAAALGTALNIQDALKPPASIYETRLVGVTGKTITLEFRAERNRNCALVAMAQWENANGVVRSKINPNKTTLPPGEERWIAIEIDLPPGTRAGKYAVRSVGEYTCAGGAVFIVPTDWVDVILE
jgi:Flp pilus assembly protein CpaB